MNERTTIWIFLSTSNLGGAELRFWGLWKYACERKSENNHIKLVGSKKLFEILLEKDNEFATNLPLETSDFVEYDLSGNIFHFREKIKKFIDRYVSPKDILHFVDGNPLIRTQAKQVFSITQSSLKNLNIKGRLIQFLGAINSDIIDVLDPKIFQIFSKFFLIKKEKLLMTTNSHCDVDKFVMAPFSEKKDWFVFLGRFEHVKQVDRLLEVIPVIYEKVKSRFNNDLRFYFLGYGSLESKLMQIKAEGKFKDIPVFIEKSKTPQNILKLSKFFFSVQLNNNWPSRSLIEAMCAGNIPICTDVGQTRWLAKPDFSFYVPELFTVEEVVSAFDQIINQGDLELQNKTTLARNTVLAEHTIEKMYEYYDVLYKKIQEKQFD